MADDNILEQISAKLDGIVSEVRTNTFRLDKFEAENRIRFDRIDERMVRVGSDLKSVKDDVKLLSNKIELVMDRVMENDDRLKVVEVRLDDSEARSH